MNDILLFLKEYVGMFLIFTIVLAVIPARQYRGYLRFFMEMVLVLFCLRQFLHLGSGRMEEQWNKSFSSFYEEISRRKEEGERMEYLDENYVSGFLEGEEGQEAGKENGQ